MLSCFSAQTHMHQQSTSYTSEHTASITGYRCICLYMHCMATLQISQLQCYSLLLIWISSSLFQGWFYQCKTLETNHMHLRSLGQLTFNHSVASSTAGNEHSITYCHPRALWTHQSSHRYINTQQVHVETISLDGRLLCVCLCFQYWNQL